MPDPTPSPSAWLRRGRVALVALGVTVATAGVAGVICAAFALSFDAIKSVGVASGTTPAIAWLLPVAVDGVMAVAAVVAVLLQLAGRSSWYPWAVTLAGVAVSVACNAAHARPVVSGVATPPLELSPDVARAVSTIPALALALSVHLIIVLAMAVLSPGDSAVNSHATAGDSFGDTVAADVADPWRYAVPVATPGDTDPVGGTDHHLSPGEATAGDTVADDLTRQRDGRDMARDGATAGEIAAATGVSLRTAQRYVAAVAKTA